MNDCESDNYIKDLSGNRYDASSKYYENESPLTLGKDYAYSFAIVGDTQRYVWKDYNTAKDDNVADTNYTANIYKWIVENKDSKNIKYVMGLGDITEKNGLAKNSSSDLEWEIAKAAITQLDNNVEYSLVMGNHDTAARLTEYFGDHKYLTDRITGYYEDGDARLGNYYINFDVEVAVRTLSIW